MDRQAITILLLARIMITISDFNVIYKEPQPHTGLLGLTIQRNPYVLWDNYDRNDTHAASSRMQRNPELRSFCFKIWITNICVQLTASHPCVTKGDITEYKRKEAPSSPGPQ